LHTVGQVFYNTAVVHCAPIVFLYYCGAPLYDAPYLLRLRTPHANLARFTTGFAFHYVHAGRQHLAPHSGFGQDTAFYTGRLALRLRFGHALRTGFTAATPTPQFLPTRRILCAGRKFLCRSFRCVLSAGLFLLRAGLVFARTPYCGLRVASLISHAAFCATRRFSFARARHCAVLVIAHRRVFNIFVWRHFSHAFYVCHISRQFSWLVSRVLCRFVSRTCLNARSFTSRASSHGLTPGLAFRTPTRVYPGLFPAATFNTGVRIGTPLPVDVLASFPRSVYSFYCGLPRALALWTPFWFTSLRCRIAPFHGSSFWLLIPTAFPRAPLRAT